MKIACYGRVSSAIQAANNGVDSQRAGIEAWVNARGAAEVEAPPVWFIDNAVSGKSMNRPQWNAMLERVRAGEFNTIIAYDLSRCGRTLKGLLEWIDEMLALKVRVIFIKDNLDLDTAMGRLILQIMGSLAEYTRSLIADRVRDGVRTKIKANGGKWGRSLSPCPFSEAEVAQMRVHRDAGLSAWAIAQKIGRDHRSVKRWIQVCGAEAPMVS